MRNQGASILLIYTGGTIGMKHDPVSGALKPFDFGQILDEVPELGKFAFRIDAYTFDPLIDSSDVEPAMWVDLARLIRSRYDSYDGFVILHGTDTMAFSASALSFMLENLGKPVILTGSQLPIDMLRTDGKENLISAIEIAATRRSDGSPMVPEVCIYFKEKLLRGNRTTKISAEQFNAFRSFNYPELAKAGIHIRYNEAAIRRPDPSRPMKAHYLVDPNVVVLSLFPGIQQRLVHAVLNIPGLKAVVLRTFGAGNAPQAPWFRDELQDATSRGILLVNITQCQDGAVHMGLYETSLPLIDAGVVCGYDSTPECAIAKLMFLLGHQLPPEELRRMMDSDLAGEITKS